MDNNLEYLRERDDSLLEKLDGSYEEIADRLKQFMKGEFDKDSYKVQKIGTVTWSNDWIVENKKTGTELLFNKETIHLAEEHQLLEKGEYAIDPWKFYHEFMPTIEMRVHHLDTLRNHIEDEQKLEAIKGHLLDGFYDQEVTKKEFNDFALTIYKFYEKILEGKHRIKLTSELDGICNGGCTYRKIGGCNLIAVSEHDVKKAKIDAYNVEIGRSYSLRQILDVIEQYVSLEQK